MASNDLKTVLVDRLENTGVLNELRARIRAEMLAAMEGKESKPPPLTNENLLINELIRDYFMFNRYHNSCSVLVTESGQPREPLDREFLCRELKMNPDHTTKSLPLLYTMLAYFMTNTSTTSHQVMRSQPQQSMTSDSSSVEDDETTEEQSHTTNNYTTHITDNITITQPVCDDQQ